MNLLAIETSCDETAAAVIRDGRQIVSSIVSSQISLHAPHGGVVPELAARAHLEAIAPVVASALEPLSGGLADIDAIAVTRGPGLVGCLIVGAGYAQALAAALDRPIVAVSHLAGHVYSAWLHDHELEPPFLGLVVSGGHSDLVEIRAHGVAQRLGSTRDDAVGEAFDKVARLLGLPYPGGPAVERAAASGQPDRYPMPRTELDSGFSFSGLKTAVRYTVEALPAAQRDADGVPLDQQTVADIAAAFQRAAVRQLVTQLQRAQARTGAEQIAVVGGVAANGALRRAVTEAFDGLRVSIPPLRLCTDNAAMIGAAGWHRLDWHGPEAAAFDVDPGLAEFV